MKKNWILCLIALFSLASAAWSQATNEVSIDAADKAAARQAKNVFREAQPTKTVRGKASRGEDGVLTLRSSSGGKKSGNSFGRSGVRYPGDLSFHGGAVVDSANSHAIYLLPNGKCPISQCWGNPEGFLRDLSDSQFIHLVDQYIGLRASERYTLGNRAKINYTPPSVPLTDLDVLSYVHAVASATGGSGTRSGAGPAPRPSGLPGRTGR